MPSKDRGPSPLSILTKTPRLRHVVETVTPHHHVVISHPHPRHGPVGPQIKHPHHEIVDMMCN